MANEKENIAVMENITNLPKNPDVEILDQFIPKFKCNTLKLRIRCFRAIFEK